MPAKKVKTTNRGRKRKEKPQKKRIQGSGKYFNSQITCVVQSEADAAKLYKFKVFRTGAFQVPGCKTTDLGDLQQPLEDLRQYFCNIFNNTNIQVAKKCVQMRNCKTRLVEYNLCINTTELGRIIEKEMTSNKKRAGEQKNQYEVIDKDHKKRMEKGTDNLKKALEAKLDDLESDSDSSTVELLKKAHLESLAKLEVEERKRSDLKKLTLQISRNGTKDDIGIYNVEYQTAQNSSKVIVKFLRPVPKDPFKTTTLKVLKQKVNFEGAISYEDIQNIYKWLNSLLLEHYTKVIYDPAVELEKDEEIEQQQRTNNSDSDSDDTKRVIVLSSDDDDNSDIECTPHIPLRSRDHDRYMDNPYDDND